MDIFQFKKLIDCFRNEPKKTFILTFAFFIFAISVFLFWKVIDRISEPKNEVYYHVRTAEEDAVEILKNHKAKKIFENGKIFLGEWNLHKPKTIRYLEANGKFDTKEVKNFFKKNEIYCSIDVTDDISSMIWLDIWTRPIRQKNDDSLLSLTESCGGGCTCEFFNDGKSLKSAPGLKTFEVHIIDKENIYIDGDLEFYCVGLTFPRIYLKKVKK